MISSAICDGKRTEWSPIRSVIIRVIPKSFVSLDKQNQYCLLKYCHFSREKFSILKKAQIKEFLHCFYGD